MSEDFPKCKLPATLPYVERLCDLAAEKSMTTDDYFARVLRDYATAATTRADARITELERECAQWRDELRIYCETENARIAELERAVTVRDTEIARLETDLELARREVKRLGDALDLSALEYADLAVSAKSLEEHLHALVEVSEDSTIARARAVMNGDDIGEDADEDADEDESRAGNGGEG